MRILIASDQYPPGIGGLEKTTYNLVRGLQPWPGAYTDFRGQSLHIWKTGHAGEPGRRRRLLARCGDGAELELLEVQLQGKKRMPGDVFANGQRITEEGVFRFGF